jgi:hypothetical protein
MTHDELITKAEEWLRKIEREMPECMRDGSVDQMPKRQVRDAVVIDFSSDEDIGTIQVVMERDTGAPIGATHTPPKTKNQKTDDPVA